MACVIFLILANRQTELHVSAEKSSEKVCTVYVYACKYM